MRSVLSIASVAGFHMQYKRNSFYSFIASAAPPLSMFSHYFYWVLLPNCNFINSNLLYLSVIGRM